MQILVTFVTLLANILVRGPILLWFAMSYIMPRGWIQTPKNKGKIAKRILSLAKIPEVLTSENGAHYVIPDFDVMAARKMAGAEALQIIRQLKLDPFGRNGYNGQPNLGNLDLIEVQICKLSQNAMLTLYIRNYYGDNDPHTDFVPGDVVSLVMDGEWPQFLYNHATHVLANCDFWDLHIHPGTGVSIYDKGRRATRQAQQLVTNLKQQGHFAHLGAQPRIEIYHRSYDEAPEVISNWSRDIHQYAYILAGVGVLGVALYFSLWA